jgi:ectoine hydroxylase-related dioxygenase (phytanoyl-CoA dioxygenase family)
MKKLEKNIITHGVRIRKSSKNLLDLCLEEIKVKGFTIIKSGLKKNDINKIREQIDKIYNLQSKEIGGEKVLKSINDENIARATAGYNDIFIEVATLKPIQKICERLLGPIYTLISQNGIINKPKRSHYQYTWHRDLNYQHFTSSKPIAVSVLLCVDEFNEKTGGTYILSGTHKQEEFPSDAYVKKNQEVINANVGDLIVFDSMIYHRTGKNFSNLTRRCINNIYALPILKQIISFPKMLGIRKDIKDKLTRMILGYEFENTPSPSAIIWRQSKIKK